MQMPLTVWIVDFTFNTAVFEKRCIDVTAVLKQIVQN